MTLLATRSASRVIDPHRYTFTNFHFPRRNSTALMMARMLSLMGTAVKAPCAPHPSPVLRYHARGICSNRKQNAFMYVGVSVSPAPLKAWASTMP